jgi:hypothetical protein
MAIITINRNYPNPLPWEDKARNGKIPDWRLLGNAAYRHMFAATHCRKLVFHKATNPGSAPQSAAGTVTPWRWQCRTGESNDSGNTIILRAEAQVLPDDNGSGTDPRWRIFAGGNNSDYRRFPAYVASPTYEDVKTQRVDLGGLTPNTEYQCGLEVEDYGRVLSLAVWEVVPIAANTAATYISGTFQTLGAEYDITDAQHSEMVVTDPFTLWKHNGSQLLSLVPDDESNPWATTNASYENMLQAAHSTTPGANTAGFNLQTQYHNPAHTDNVNATVAVYAKATTGTGGDVKLEDSTGALATLSNFNTTGEWKSTTFNLDGSQDGQKVDVQFRISGSATALDVHAVSIYEYES